MHYAPVLHTPIEIFISTGLLPSYAIFETNKLIWGFSVELHMSMQMKLHIVNQIAVAGLKDHFPICTKSKNALILNMFLTATMIYLKNALNASENSTYTYSQWFSPRIKYSRSSLHCCHHNLTRDIGSILEIIPHNFRPTLWHSYVWVWKRKNALEKLKK